MNYIILVFYLQIKLLNAYIIGSSYNLLANTLLYDLHNECNINSTEVIKSVAIINSRRKTLGESQRAAFINISPKKPWPQTLLRAIHITSTYLSTKPQDNGR